MDGCIADRDGAVGWTAPSGELFARHLADAPVADEVAAVLAATVMDVDSGWVR